MVVLRKWCVSNQPGFSSVLRQPFGYTVYIYICVYLSTERERERRVVKYIKSTSHIVTQVHASRTMGAKLTKSDAGSRS